ncbi:MAG: DUF1127 domain-containing protein [Gammaproteobacteria bacterium]|jgi:uncharacterized protein YjiS (DUF1127 family)|nr:DUF1127 domain-containing protein [Gammaproteobacteria bacterium]MBT3724588.1 DUF1127 domain-containing protein [Gammaproteobacteria bacterium]MBT4075969.1 DUF1127 domain-containing protein [Gammaproteobacteria bacterium]MBT4193370.1 DUF1127 domain-containing protein [Gammaproteobacteria bacterium]MBT4451034.1 DUF1127 domain-containing protein [Gammaproteobacteria bacterium]
MQISAKQKVSIQSYILHSIESGVETLQLWIDRHHHRKQLSQLSDHMLKDMGLTRVDVYNEVTKPFWK